jgi:medium-chain acyl-[acyl-carrier-protein] hydrolase
VCFAHAGSGPAAFVSWPRLLPEHIETHAVLLPGRGKRLREAPVTDMAQLLSRLAPELRSLADRPIAFFGHSLGALLAFEVARAWRAAAAGMPAHLFLSGSRPPQLPRNRPPLRDASQAEFLAALQDFGGTPPEILANSELLPLILPALRGDFALAEQYRYQPEPALDIPFTLMGGSEDPRVSPATLQGWREQTRGVCRTRIFPGGHFYLEAQAPAVAAEIAGTLAPAWPAPSSRPSAG